MWVKICGVRTVEAALHAEASGADALGLNLHKPSPRWLHPDDAKEICSAVTIPTYIVVVEPSRETLETWFQHIQPYGVQFHGAQSIREAEDFGQPYLKAFEPHQTVKRNFSQRQSIAFFSMPSIHNCMEAVADGSMKPLYPRYVATKKSFLQAD